MPRLAPLTTLFVLAACQTGDVDSNPELFQGDAFGRLAGTVVDTAGAPLSGVEVSVDGLSAITDADGFYIIDAVTPAQDFTVTFESSGFAKTYRVASMVSWETVGVDAMLSAIDGADYFMASEGGTVEVLDTRVSFEPDGIVTEDGQRYNGTVRVEITHIDPYTDEVRATPGDLTALAYSDSDESKNGFEAQQLVSYGMVDVSLYSETNERLQLEDDKPAIVDMPVTNGDLVDVYAMSAGDRQRTWSFDADTGKWMEEGSGDVIEEDGEMRFIFPASHFSWWNCDDGMVPTCAEGRVVDYLGFPIRSAEVIADGDASDSTVYTDDDGYYTVSVLAGDTVDFRSSTYVADRSWRGEEPGYFIDGDGDSAEDCEDIPDIVIDVCREAGVVMVDNLDSPVAALDQENSLDQLRGWFWKPPGDTHWCDDPWDEVPTDDCIVMDEDDATSVTVILEEHDTHSVGDWIEIEAPGDEYLLDHSILNGDVVYFEETLNVTKGMGPQVEESFVVIEPGDDLLFTAPGSPDAYFGPVDHVSIVTVPPSPDATPVPDEVDRNDGLDIAFEGAGNIDEIMVIVATADDDSDDLICKFEDDGRASIRSEDLRQMDAGWASVSVIRPSFDWVAGPDGLPIRIQAISSTILETELR